MCQCEWRTFTGHCYGIMKIRVFKYVIAQVANVKKKTDTTPNNVFHWRVAILVLKFYFIIIINREIFSIPQVLYLILYSNYLN
jgi:hypothetical protein